MIYATTRSPPQTVAENGAPSTLSPPPEPEQPEPDAAPIQDDDSILQSYLENHLPAAFTHTKEPQVAMAQPTRQDPTSFFTAENTRLRDTVRQLREENRLAHAQKEAYRVRLEALREKVVGLELKVEETLYCGALPKEVFEGLLELLEMCKGVKGNLL